MGSRLRRLSGTALAALAVALVLVLAPFPAGMARAAAEEGAPGGRVIPVAPVDPGSREGRVMLPIADWLEQRLGAGSDGLRLSLSEPMWAEEREGTVTVHLPGARLEEPSAGRDRLDLGDLAIAVTPRGGAAYDFESALPPAIGRRAERLAIGESAVSGTWRSDLEIATRLEVTATRLRAFERTSAGGATIATLAAIALADELFERADGLWDGRYSLSFSGLESEDLSLGAVEVAGSFEGLEREAVLRMRRDFGIGMLGEVELAPDALDFAFAPLFEGRWGRSDATVTIRDLTMTISRVDMGGEDRVALGELVWQVAFDDRAALPELATRLTVTDLLLGWEGVAGLPSAFMPQGATVDMALERLPLRRLAEAFSALEERGDAPEGRRYSLPDDVLAHLDAADTALDLREIHVRAPSYEFWADGSLRVEPASPFGLVGRVNARIAGLSELLALAAREGDEAAVAFLVVLQGLGRPVLDEGAGAAVHAYEFDLRRDGAVTVNGIPLDVLFRGDLSP